MSDFNVGVEFQCVVGLAAIFLVLMTERDAEEAVAEFDSCEVTVGEELFEFFPGLDVVGYLPLLDPFDYRGQFGA